MFDDWFSTAPSGNTAIGQRADSEFTFQDQTRITSSLSDLLSAATAGLQQAAKTTLSQTLNGGGDSAGFNMQSNGSFLDVFKQGLFDKLVASKTGQQIQSDVVAAKVRQLLYNPITWVVVGIVTVLLVRKFR